MKYPMFLVVLVLSGCFGGYQKLSPQWIDTATRQTVVDEIRKVHGHGGSFSEYERQQYLSQLLDRLQFLEPGFKGDVNDPHSFEISLLRNDDEKRLIRENEEIQVQDSKRAPSPEEIATFSEWEVRKHLELLDRGELSGGYSDEDLRGYGRVSADEEAADAPSANLSAREEFRSFLKERLCDFYPEWGHSGRAAVVEGRLFNGMSREQIIASWGRPNYINKLENSSIYDEEWGYEGFNLIYLKNGRLLSFKADKAGLEEK